MKKMSRRLSCSHTGRKNGLFVRLVKGTRDHQDERPPPSNYYIKRFPHGFIICFFFFFFILSFSLLAMCACHTVYTLSIQLLRNYKVITNQFSLFLSLCPPLNPTNIIHTLNIALRLCP